MLKNGLVECHRNRLGNGSPTVRTVSKAYDHHHANQANRLRGLSVILVVVDCLLVSLQPILVYMSKVNGKFEFSPVSVNFLTESTKVAIAILMLLIQSRRQRPGEKSLLSPKALLQAARANSLLALPAALYAVNNYLKFIMQLYFDPATVKMLSNLKVLMIALLMKIVMKRRFTVLQWEALALLLIGISVNQLHTTSDGSVSVPIKTTAYVYTLVFVTIPSMASVFNEHALKSQYETSVHIQNLLLYGYGAIFNLLAIFFQKIVYEGGSSLDLLHGHSRATMWLILNNAAQGILSCFFLKYADAILKKYSSSVATIFTALASAALFGHKLRINFVLGVSIVIISMHQFFSSMAKTKENKEQINSDAFLDKHNTYTRPKDESFISMATGAAEDANLKIGILDDRQPLLPT